MSLEKLMKARQAFDASRKGTLWTARNIILAIFALLYFLSPIDLVPDWAFPFVGWLDDLGIIALVGLWMKRRAAPPEAPGDASCPPKQH